MLLTRKKKLYIIVFFVLLISKITMAEEEKDKINFTGNKFNSITIDTIDSTLIWFGTTSGIIQYNRKSKKWIYPNYNVINVNSIAIDPFEKDVVWIGTDIGINKFNRSNGKIEKVKIKEEFVKSDTTSQLELDSTNVRKNDSTTISISYNIKDIVIDTIDKDNIWAAASDGLLKYIRKDDKWTVYTKKEGLLDNKINTIAIDKFNTDIIWIGTGKGINIYKRNKEKEQLEGLTQEENKLSEISINSIAIDGMYVLFGNINGVDIYNKNDKTWKLYSESMKNGAPKDRINCIELDKNRLSYVWFGTQRNGILGFDKLANVWHKFNSQKNMRISAITSDIIEKEKLWALVNICSGGGVIQYNRTSNNWYITEPMINLLGDLDYKFNELN